jgi:hypothetical protein
MSEAENKPKTKMSNNKQILFAGLFIVIAVCGIFVYDYFETKALLKNGIRCNAAVIGRYYEVSSNNDTSSYSMRLQPVQDTSTQKGNFLNVAVLNAYVKKETFYKYGEGSIVKVVYSQNETDRAKLVEEIE